MSNYNYSCIIYILNRTNSYLKCAPGLSNDWGSPQSAYIETAIASLNDVNTTYRALSEVIVAKVLKGSFPAVQPILSDIH